VHIFSYLPEGQCTTSIQNRSLEKCEWPRTEEDDYRTGDRFHTVCCMNSNKFVLNLYIFLNEFLTVYMSASLNFLLIYHLFYGR
jgi:hypothetical protein